MYKQSLKLLLKNIKYIILVVLLAVITQMLTRYFPFLVGFGVIRILLYSIFARLIFHELIFGKDNYSRVIVVNWFGFVWRGFLVAALVYLPSFIASSFIFRSMINGSFENHGLFVNIIADYAANLNVGLLTSFLIAILVSYIVGQFVFVVTTPMILPLIGTLVPAFVKQERMGIANAIHRGKGLYGQIASRIILGPMLVHTISSVLMFFVVGPSAVGQFRKTWEVNISHIGISVFGELLFAFEIVMIVWILSSAYMTSISDPTSNKMIDENEQTK